MPIAPILPTSSKLRIRPMKRSFTDFVFAMMAWPCPCPEETMIGRLFTPLILVLALVAFRGCNPSKVPPTANLGQDTPPEVPEITGEAPDPAMNPRGRKGRTPPPQPVTQPETEAPK